MEFDIGTLIYIIITIIAVVAGALGRKKKPQQTTPSDNEPAGESTGSGGFFGKLGEQFEGFIEEAKEATQFNTQKEPEPEPVQVESEKAYESILDQYNFTHDDNNSDYADFEGVFDPDSDENKPLIEAEATRSTESPTIEIIDIDKQENPDYFEIVQDFDLGTAVVYSTIINRKEY